MHTGSAEIYLRFPSDWVETCSFECHQLDQLQNQARVIGMRTFSNWRDRSGGQLEEPLATQPWYARSEEYKQDPTGILNFLCRYFRIPSSSEPNIILTVHKKQSEALWTELKKTVGA